VCFSEVTKEMNDNLFAIGDAANPWSAPAPANRLSINTYIYIFPHNLCKMQVFNLVFDSQILRSTLLPAL